MGKLVFLPNVNFKQHINIQIRFLDLDMKHVEDTVHCLVFFLKLFSDQYVPTTVRI